MLPATLRLDLFYFDKEFSVDARSFCSCRQHGFIFSHRRLLFSQLPGPLLFLDSLFFLSTSPRSHVVLSLLFRCDLLITVTLLSLSLKIR